MTDIQLVQ